MQLDAKSLFPKDSHRLVIGDCSGRSRTIDKRVEPELNARELRPEVDRYLEHGHKICSMHNAESEVAVLIPELIQMPGL